MVLNPDILNSIEQSRKHNPNAKKKIMYFVGANACGKTTKLKTLQYTYGKYYQYISQNGIMSFLLDQPSVYNKNAFYLNAMWDRLIAAIKVANNTNQNIIFVDGHPLLSILCSQAIFSVHGESMITSEQVDILNEKHLEILNYVKDMKFLEGFEQIIYYINIPLELNIELLQNQQSCVELEENEEKELITLRETIHSQIFELAKKHYNTKVVEVNTLIGLDIIHMYLLGTGCC